MNSARSSVDVIRLGMGKFREEEQRATYLLDL